MVFHWSLSESKSPQVSRTRLSILAVLSNAVVWIVSTRPPTSKSSRPFNNHLVIVPNAPITIGIIVTFMFHSFFNSLARSRYLSFFSPSFRFILWSAGTAKSTILQILFFCWLLLSLLFLLLLLFTPWEFFLHQRQLIVFYWSLSDSKSPQVSRTFLSILAVLDNVVVWMVTTHPLISKSSSPFNNPLLTIPKSAIMIGIIVTLLFHSFFSSLARSMYSSNFSLSFIFIL